MRIRGLPPSGTAGFSSCLRIPVRNAPDAKKLIASTSTAYGAVIRPMSPPATPGPEICAIVRLTSSFELPSMICSRSTRDGRYDW